MNTHTQMPPRDAAAVLALLITPGVGHDSVRGAVHAAARAGLTPHALLRTSLAHLVRIMPAGRADLAAKVASCRADEVERAATMLDRLIARGGRIHCIGDDGYPAALGRSLPGAEPPLLTSLGSLSILGSPALAAVGTRRPSAKGRTVAAEAARWAVKEGATLVSGAAKGVDMAAHEAALEAKGTTAAVLPQGLLSYRPPKCFAEGVKAERCVLVSQFPPDTPWERYAAVMRNATIAALSRVVLVVEPRKTGGSVRTGMAALKQGAPVLVWRGKANEKADALEAAGAVVLHCAEPAEVVSVLRQLLQESERAPASPGLFDCEP